MIAEFGPPSRTGRAQSAAYPFTRLRADGVWVLDHDVPMDLAGPLTQRHVTGRFEPSVESALLARPSLVCSAARDLVNGHFPATLAPDVLLAAGLDPDSVLGAGVLGDPETAPAGPCEFRPRSASGRPRAARYMTCMDWELRPRPGTAPAAAVHVAWHAREVFKGEPLLA
jgi:hypothetical protein